MKLDIAKKIIRKNINYARCGIFDTRNVLGDPMESLYCDNGLQIDICFRYEYFEVFGLNGTEFSELKSFYKKLLKTQGITTEMLES